MPHTVVIAWAGGNYSSYVPDLPGCVSTGRTVDEVRTNIGEAIGLPCDGLRAGGQPIPPPSSLVAYVEPQVA